MSTRIEGATAHVLVTAHATLSTGSVDLSLSAREGPASGTWRYNLTDAPGNRTAGRVAGMTDPMAVLRYAAGVAMAGYGPGTVQRGLLEQFAADKLGGGLGMWRACACVPRLVRAGSGFLDVTGVVVAACCETSETAAPAAVAAGTP
jgi:hypothetical protein